MQQPLILGDLSLSYSSHGSYPRSPLPLTSAPGMLDEIHSSVHDASVSAAPGGIAMVAPVEVGEGGIALLGGNGLLKEHEMWPLDGDL